MFVEYLNSGYDAQWLLVVGSTGEGGTLDISDAEGEFSSPFAELGLDHEQLPASSTAPAITATWRPTGARRQRRFD